MALNDAYTAYADSDGDSIKAAEETSDGVDGCSFRVGDAQKLDFKNGELPLCIYYDITIYWVMTVYFYFFREL